MFERRLLGGAAGLILLFWLSICVTDVNHPPGTRYVRLVAAALVLAICALEYYRPWRGFCVYLFLWPQALLLRELLGRYLSPLFAGPGPGGMPDYWAGGMTSALAVAVWLRAEKFAPAHPAATGHTREERWLRWFRVGLWIFVLAWLLSGIVSFVRLLNPPKGWLVDPPDWRHLLVPSMSRTIILYALHAFLPAFLLGLLLLNLLRTHRHLPQRDQFIPPGRTFALWSGLAGIVVAIQVFWQAVGDWTWPFSVLSKAGPFSNRNSAGPVLVLSGLLLLLGVWRHALPVRIAGGLGAALIWTAGFVTTSRNGVMMLALLPWLALFFRAGRARIVAGVALPVIIALALWKMPTPKPEEIANPTLNRLAVTITALKTGDWKEFTSVRMGLWETALNISKEHRVLGSGPGTFPMLAHPESQFRSAETIYVYGSAHSLPLNLLAETGPVTMLAWFALFVVLPWLALVRWKRANALALAVVLVGLGNLFDTVMLVSGMTTLCVLLMPLAMAEEIDVSIRD